MNKQASRKELKTMSNLMACSDRVLLTKTLCEQKWACPKQAMLAFESMCIIAQPPAHLDIMLDYALSHLTPSWVMDYVKDFKIDNLMYHEKVAVFQWIKDKHEASNEELDCYRDHIECLLMTRRMPRVYFIALLEVSWPIVANTTERAFYHVRQHFSKTPLQLLKSDDARYESVMPWVAEMVFSKGKTSPATLLQQVPESRRRYVVTHLSRM